MTLRAGFRYGACAPSACQQLDVAPTPSSPQRVKHLRCFTAVKQRSPLTSRWGREVGG
jgi:hypothetical protein